VLRSRTWCRHVLVAKLQFMNRGKKVEKVMRHARQRHRLHRRNGQETASATRPTRSDPQGFRGTPAREGARKGARTIDLVTFCDKVVCLSSGPLFSFSSEDGFGVRHQPANERVAGG